MTTQEWYDYLREHEQEGLPVFCPKVENGAISFGIYLFGGLGYGEMRLYCLISGGKRWPPPDITGPTERRMYENTIAHLKQHKQPISEPDVQWCFGLKAYPKVQMLCEHPWGVFHTKEVRLQHVDELNRYAAVKETGKRKPTEVELYMIGRTEAEVYGNVIRELENRRRLEP